MADLNALFWPRGIAVIGASNRPLTIGNRVMVNLKEYGFGGPVHAVNPKGEEVLGKPAYKSILDIPDPIDLVHIIVKNTLVQQTLEDCAKKGVKVAVVNASGFREIGPEGVLLEQKLVETGRRLGIRIFGPNCQGVMNTDPSIKLYSNFTFAPMTPGHVSIVAQGGGVAEVINNYFGMNGVGQRMYASNGNAADISIPEIIEYYGDDPGTRVIVLHLESFADPDEFLARVRPVAQKKPVLALKSGTTEEGARAVSSHTGGLMAKDTTSEVLFDKCGILRFASLGELCEAAAAFNGQPVPAGPRIGMVTNAGSPAIIVTDEAVRAGLVVPPLAEATQATLKEKLQSLASVHNPIDMMATASGKEFSVALEALLADANIDAAVITFMTPFFVDTTGIAAAIEDCARTAKKPLIAVAMTNTEVNPEWRETVARVRAAGVPVYYFPEAAARVLVHMDRYRRLRDRPEAEPPALKVERARAAEVLARAELSREGFMEAADASALMAAYGIPLAPEARAADFGELERAASKLGYPVVLKAESPSLVHKTEAGAVVLGIQDGEALRRAFDDLRRRLRSTPALSFLLQRELPPGLEVIVGAAPGAGNGKMVMVGLGGILVEVLRDTAFKLAPLNRPEAEEMLARLKAAKLLDGVRGKPGIDRAALVDILLRVSRLVQDHREIQELDLNPILCYPEGKRTAAVDVRVRLAR